MKSKFLFSFLVFIIFCPFLKAQWNQIGSDVFGVIPYDNFGWVLDMDSIGDSFVTISRNGSGQAGVFQWDGSQWSQKGNSFFGDSVYLLRNGVGISADGNTIVLGNSTFQNILGRISVYQWNGTAWLPKGASIFGEEPSDGFGGSVAISSDGDRVAIGAGGNSGNGTNSGHVRVYEWTNNVWVQMGLDIDGEAANDYSGAVSLSSSGNTVAIGAARNDGNGVNSGHVRIFDYNGLAWVQRGADIDGERLNSYSAVNDLSADGNTVIVGASLNGIPPSFYLNGQARVFTWNGTSWVQKGQDIHGINPGDYCGNSVAINYSGDTIAVGALYHNGSGPRNNKRGHVRVFAWHQNSWVLVENGIDGRFNRSNNGRSVCLNASGTRVATGATGGGNGSPGYVMVYEPCLLPDQRDTLYPRVCDAYTVPSGNATYTISGVYKDTLAKAMACGDSLLTIYLTVDSSSASTQNITACESYTWINGVQYTNSVSGITHVVPNSMNCDSTLLLNLSITHLDTSLIQQGISLMSNDFNASYQWLDCNLNWQVIQGETAQSYTPQINGVYAVEVSKNNCKDTSACLPVIGVGLAENKQMPGFMVFPNPSKGTFNLVFEKLQDFVQVEVYAINGKKLSVQTFKHSPKLAINLQEFPKGLYLLKIVNNEGFSFSTRVLLN